MLKYLELLNIFSAAIPQDVFCVDVHEDHFGCNVALLADAHRQLCDVKSRILGSVNSSLTKLRMEPGKAGLRGFPYVIINCLWSIRTHLLLNYSFRQATIEKLAFS